jgi:hypothetical protein
LSYFKDDALGMSELALVNREALWQLQAIMNDCLRRWPTLGRVAPRWKSPWRMVRGLCSADAAGRPQLGHECRQAVAQLTALTASFARDGCPQV